MEIFNNINSNIQKYDKSVIEKNTQKIDDKNQIHIKEDKIKENIDSIEKQSKDKIKEELKRVVEELNNAMNPLNKDLKFHFNDKVDELVVKVIEKNTNRVIREFPPKEALELMQKMRELVGLLFDKKG